MRPFAKSTFQLYHIHIHKHIFTKHRESLGFSERYTSKGLSLKSPAAFAPSKRVILSLAALYPGMDSSSSAMSVLNGIFFQKSLVSATLKTC
uniref:Uncharacterized protein n=1 Tax=Chrysemys picta bellii TaxID=8478 RepID=A0A8C3FKU8_CHRPI